MHDLNRRQFLAGAGALGSMGRGTAASRAVAIVMNPSDPVAAAAPARWAAGELQAALVAAKVAVRRCENLAEASAADLCIVASGSGAPDTAEGLRLATENRAGRQVITVAGRDPLGLVYALLELADRVRHAADPVAALAVPQPVVERPANRVRSVTRLFTSDVEDKPWYNDREMWPHYLSLLVAQRFNRLNLALGIGYDFLRNVTDAYFLFAYPFLLEVPGYKVRAPQLPDAERDRNLEMLKFIARETVARGLTFQLGLWMHGYEWIDSPHPNYTIEGLTRANHGPYCRDAVRLLLREVPEISAVTFRIHGESGVEEGSYEFWKTVFQGVATCGRKVGIDMHAKGMDQAMMDVALGAGPPVTISPKYWAEHMGMPYHQADIRELERPRPGKEGTGLMKFSAGSRSFLRYGYGDLLREDRTWSVVHRIWPGTQRLLLWADPVTAAAHSRAFGFCGSDGVEIMEPLSFKGRRGSGIAGDRAAYRDASLRPRWDWEKYVYGHRVWGRLLYNPAADPDQWRRYLRQQFGPGARAAEEALANASRILPIVTTAHAASAGNNSYWPEVYLNQSMTDAEHPGPYRDSPAPRVFGNVSPLDPQLFSRMNDFADELLDGEISSKYSPVEVAQWIEDYAAAAQKHLLEAGAQVRGRDRPEFRRLAIDVAIQAGIGRFFGAKFRAGVLYRIYEKTGDRMALEESIRAYRHARTAWSELAEHGKVYVADITVGENPQLRGHWADRLPAIDADIATLEKKLEGSQPAGSTVIKSVTGRPQRAAIPCSHTPVPRYRPGQPLTIELTPRKKVESVRLFYRHVDQAERFESVAMQPRDNRYSAVIPPAYTDSHYPLEYYFELRESRSAATLYPGFHADLANQPYFVVRRDPASA